MFTEKTFALHRNVTPKCALNKIRDTLFKIIQNGAHFIKQNTRRAFKWIKKKKVTPGSHANKTMGAISDHSHSHHIPFPIYIDNDQPLSTVPVLDEANPALPVLVSSVPLE